MWRMPCSKRDPAASAALLAVHLLFTVSSIVVGKAARDAIFLSHYTLLQLTTADLVTAGVVGGAVWCHLRLRERLSTRRVLLWSPLCFALGDLALWYGLAATAHHDSAPDRAWIVHVAYLWIAIQTSLGAPQATVLACRVLTSVQAVRLSGVVGAGASLGWICGGVITHLVASHWDASALFIACAILVSMCPGIVLLAYPPRRPSHVGRPGNGTRRATPSAPRVSRAWVPPPLRAIAALALVSSAVTTIAGFQFRAAATAAIGNEAELAAFFGTFSVNAGLVSLVIQLLFTARIVEQLGVGPALAIAPLALALGSCGVAWWGTLASAVFLKGTDQILRYSVDRAAVEMLYRPFEPDEIFEGKTLVDAVVSRAGDALGGAIAFVGARVLHLSFPLLSVASLALLALWVVCVAMAVPGSLRIRPWRPGSLTWTARKDCSVDKATSFSQV